MASPPFNINQLVPQDNDIASQFPATERTFRDVVESWFLIDGNANGRWEKKSLDHKDSDPAGTADVTTVWADTNGTLKFRIGTGNVQYLGDAPGTLKIWLTNTPPEGYVLVYGQACTTSVSTPVRTMLLDASSPFGSSGGDPLLPDLRGRVVIGQDDMGGTSANRITTAGSGIDGDVLGATGGAESVTLTVDEIPEGLEGTTDSATDSVQYQATQLSSASAGSGIPDFMRTPETGSDFAVTEGHVHDITIDGGGEAHNNVQPGIVLNFIMKT
jgi:microcystin-dependent protein